MAMDLAGILQREHGSLPSALRSGYSYRRRRRAPVHPELFSLSFIVLERQLSLSKAGVWSHTWHGCAWQPAFVSLPLMLSAVCCSSGRKGRRRCLLRECHLYNKASLCAEGGCYPQATSHQADPVKHVEVHSDAVRIVFDGGGSDG